MTQNFANSLVFGGNVGFADGPNLDSFSRLRTSNPSYVFDGQLTYNLQPLIYEQITSGGGGTKTVTHDATNSCALMTFTSATTGANAYMQSYEHFRYQAGRSQLVFITFNFIEAVTDVLKFAGYSAGATNGVEFQLSGSTLQFVIYSDTANGDQTVVQSNWNFDKLDGTGASGLTLDITKTQILVIDMQALYVGRVRMGFDIDGQIVYAHEFLHANTVATPYIQTANLPVRCGMSCTGTVTTTMRFVCCSVISEGGADDELGYSFSQVGTGTAGNDTPVHILSVRPKTTFNSIANRSKFILESLEVIVTGNAAIRWDLCIGETVTGTTVFNDVNATYSAMEYNTAGTYADPAIIIASGYCVSAAQTKGAVERSISLRYPITLDADGAIRANGTLSLNGTGIGATSAMQTIFNWKEIR